MDGAEYEWPRAGVYAAPIADVPVASMTAVANASASAGVAVARSSVASPSVSDLHGRGGAAAQNRAKCVVRVGPGCGCGGTRASACALLGAHTPVRVLCETPRTRLGGRASA